MSPFIIDPSCYDKQVAFNEASTYVYGFLDVNSLAHPRSLVTVAETKHKNRWRDYGWYQFGGTMFVNLKKSRVPVKVPGFSWSYTGFKSDLTAPGILAHEMGHHVHHLMEKRHDRKDLLDVIKALSKAEAPVSGYEPNAYETFAEAMRLFIMNPSLLREGRPFRFTVLSVILGLKPPHDVPWREVLRNAHPRIINAAEGWIRR